jgi:hypothetical protein
VIISVIIPAYNEAARVGMVVRDVLLWLIGLERAEAE